MRMQAVLVVLHKNKSIAHSFIQVDPTKRFVAGPKAETKGKDENITCHGNRDQLIREGAKAKKVEGKTAEGKKTMGKEAES
ncbi:hypothetical protein NCU07602 [Neurospora crassa OR74A]|uniref:Uncharacterized protein n=1 Tax=Neurospora crassa (strain ATCC 24698 / 74-OR23-1A / CBS 708.71 / DSM 1257 / FGSC 987) TaxID=367110 RepID=Q7SBF4_NEUCR|nr:hypothetical protein NCU07602 [Neurospora crassa OR74A]EAA33746.1 hypothetical protein NCU07602 [Neurospora crassa OR74A]|eukprot:XP_962982.1 hypothetical protein NCU07602 [Neurospora crassa OR74A]